MLLLIFSSSYIVGQPNCFDPNVFKMDNKAGTALHGGAIIAGGRRKLHWRMRVRFMRKGSKAYIVKSFSDIEKSGIRRQVVREKIGNFLIIAGENLDVNYLKLSFQHQVCWSFGNFAKTTNDSVLFHFVADADKAACKTTNRRNFRKTDRIAESPAAKKFQIL